ncbi:MAG: hypothetical protein DRP79_01125 [Planctomycetota bacterium]|nr:MAG: hypothetical protein DRP79_01125 [Planctomycetota bacterium]
MAQNPLSRRAGELTRALVEAGVLTREQAGKVERLLAEGRQEKAGKLLGKYMDEKTKSGNP